MKFGFNLKFISLFFLAVLAFYLASFYGIEHLRHRQGPWTVTFQTGPDKQPQIKIEQPSLNIQAVNIQFLEQQNLTTNLPATVVFDFPGKPVPFGKVLFEDLTTLPGVVTLDLFGHEIELLPRVLVIDRQQIPWRPTATIALSPTNKLAQPALTP